MVTIRGGGMGWEDADIRYITAVENRMGQVETENNDTQSEACKNWRIPSGSPRGVSLFSFSLNSN